MRSEAKNKEMQTITDNESSQSVDERISKILSDENGDEVFDLLKPDQLKEYSFSIPIDEIASLGLSATSLVPYLRTVTKTVTANTSGLFRVANASPGDILKISKDGNLWGALKRADGTSKMAKFSHAEPVETMTTTTMPVDATSVMMAAALYSIEKKLDQMAEIQKEILSFLENEKESQIEADVQMLFRTISEFKDNLNNEVYVNGHYKLALDMKRTAEKNIRSYEKEIMDMKINAPVIVNANVEAAVKALIRKFRYYRLSLHIYALASFVEQILLGSFKEEQITKVKKDIENRSMKYRELYAQRSAYIEKIAGNAVDTSLLKGIGDAGKTLGEFLGGIPLVKEGPVDNWLRGGGSDLKKNAKKMESSLLRSLSGVGSPETGVFTEKLDELNRICNHTNAIYCDSENVYLKAV